MRTLLPVLAVAFLLSLRSHAAISVGPAGSGVLSFPELPSVTEWSTLSLPGNELTFTTAAALDAAVQTYDAGSISTPLLDGLGAVPPGQNTVAAWSGGGMTALWTRPAASSATLLMATLQNSTGEDQSLARISYTLDQSGTSPAEQAAAHQVYYSFTGAPGTWVKIAALSGGSAGPRSELIALNGVWMNGAPLYILWADDNTTGGVDRGYSLDDVLFTGRPRPTLEAVPDLVTDVLRPVFLSAVGRSAVPGSRLLYSLEPGAPGGARIHATNGVLVWHPTRADAATTNQFTVRVTDAGAPALSAAQTFTVVVKDYVELSLSEVVMEGGQRTNVLLASTTTAPLTNLSVTLVLPSDRLTQPITENLATSVALLTLDDSQPGRLVLNFAALPGQSLTGTQLLARVTFTAAPEPASAFVALRMEEVAAARALPGLAPSLLINPGRAVIVNREPLVEAFRTGGGRMLGLYGHPGTNYTLESAPSPNGPWQPQSSINAASVVTLFDTSASTNAPGIFYRARQGPGAPAAPALSRPTGANTPEKVSKSKRLKQKRRIPATRRADPALLVPR